MTMTKSETIVSLRSQTCPGCSGFKRSRRSVCSMCWSKLPSRLRNPLYKLAGRGYEKAINDAVDHLTASVASE